MQGIITQRQTKNKNGTDCDELEKDYIVFFEELGHSMTPVSNFQKIDFNGDFLVLTGGGNIYAEQPERDKIEKHLFYDALKKGKPIIAICRGMQYINLMLGGQLSKNAELKTERPNRLDHKVIIKDREVMVNNFHDDVIFADQLSEKLKILALDKENDTVEAFYSDEMKILGVQWHPERAFNDDKDKEFSKNLIDNYLKNGEIK